MSVSEAAAADLFARYHAPLRRYLARYTGDPELADDLAQEAFVRLLERRPAEDIVRPWLFRVATNLARDTARMKSRRRLLVLSGKAATAHADPAPTPERRVERARARQAVQSAFEALSEKERTALLMREEGFTHREIADALETTTGSVGTLLARALRKAAARLEKERET